MTPKTTSLAAALEAEHRVLDEHFGRFLAATERRDLLAAQEAIEQFDETLRRHTALEEERLYPQPGGGKLSPAPEETAAERQTRQMRLEHVQIREVSGMMRRLLTEKEGLDSARALAGNLARRWDAHVTREEREIFPRLAGEKPGG